MKPKNFPERKNERRKAALARLKAQGGKSESVALLERRVSLSARDVRTKKDRRSRAKVGGR